MKIFSRPVVGLATVLLAAVAVVALNGKPGSSTESSAAPNSLVAEEPSALALATNLRIQVKDSKAEAGGLLDPAAPAWSEAQPTAIILNRTPRIYPTEPALDFPAPRCEVRALRAGGKLMLRLAWDDKTKNAPEAPPAKSETAKQEGGSEEKAQLYKRPTGETSAFADAAAVMIPDEWTGPSFPSLLMGDKQTSVRLYYWNATRGTAELKASGRATPQPTGLSIPSLARHANDQWTLTMELPDRREGYPIAFAVWDGATGDRDGLKFFSVWHVLTRFLDPQNSSRLSQVSGGTP